MKIEFKTKADFWLGYDWSTEEILIINENGSIVIADCKHFTVCSDICKKAKLIIMKYNGIQLRFELFDEEKKHIGLFIIFDDDEHDKRHSPPLPIKEMFEHLSN